MQQISDLSKVLEIMRAESVCSCEIHRLRTWWVSFGGSKERQLIVAEHFLLTLILPLSLCGPTSGNDEEYAHVVSFLQQRRVSLQLCNLQLGLHINLNL